MRVERLRPSPITRQDTRMKMPILAALVIVVGTGSFCCAGEPLPRSSPEAQGVSSAALIEFIEAADQKIESMNSFMLVCHGHVVAEGWWEPYSAEAPHSLYSLSKSFTFDRRRTGHRRGQAKGQR